MMSLGHWTNGSRHRSRVDEIARRHGSSLQGTWKIATQGPCRHVPDVMSDDVLATPLRRKRPERRGGLPPRGQTVPET